MRLSVKLLAGVAYAGTPGCSADCVTAVLQLLFYGKRIEFANILTRESSHCLQLSMGKNRSVTIKSGFASGYFGEGPISDLRTKASALGVEQEGWALLFIGTYMAHRNPRAHQEQLHGLSHHIFEFLLLNHLFNLE